MSFSDLHEIAETFSLLATCLGPGELTLHAPPDRAAYMREYRALNHPARKEERARANAKRPATRAARKVANRKEWSEGLKKERIERRTRLRLRLTPSKPIN